MFDVDACRAQFPGLAGEVGGKPAVFLDGTEGTVKAMLATRLKGVLAGVLVAGLALAGAAGLLDRTQAAGLPKAKEGQPAARTGGKAGGEKQPTKEEKLKALVEKVLTAHGGEDKLAKLQFTMTVKHSNGYTNRYFVQPPKNFRWEQQHQDQTGKMIVILFPQGRRWWTKEPNGEPKEFIPLGAEPKVEYWHDYVKFFGPRQVLRLKDAEHKVALLDEEAKIGDRAAIGVEVTGPKFTFPPPTGRCTSTRRRTCSSRASASTSAKSPTATTRSLTASRLLRRKRTGTLTG